MPLTRVLGLCGAVLWLGCASDRQVAPDLTVDGFPETVAREYCEARSRCTCDDAEMDRSACEAEQREAITSAREAAIDEGYAYDQACVETYLAFIDALSCAEVVDATTRAGLVDFVACRVFRGGQAVGAACTDPGLDAADPCGAGLRCEDGECVEYFSQGLGAACDLLGSDCALGLRCLVDDSATGPVCTALPGAGEPCFEAHVIDSVVSMCDSASWCDDGTCRALPGLGEACVPAGVPAQLERCAWGGVCGASDRCVTAPAVGEPCGELSTCAEDGRCNADGQCVELLPLVCSLDLLD